MFLKHMVSEYQRRNLALACSKPSISVSKVDRSLSPTVILLLELPPLQVKERKFQIKEVKKGVLTEGKQINN